MDKDGWIAQLGRLYAEIPQPDDNVGATPYVEQFNRILLQLQEEFPENEFVQETEKVTRGQWGDTEANQEIKLKCGQLADSLGHDISDNELDSLEDITLISLNSEQTSEQTVSQDVSIDQVIEMVNYTTLGQAQKNELKEVVHRFEDELDGDKDSGTLRELLNNAEEYSTDVAAKLAMLCLKKGVTGILNLG